jgi:hypothetical protein
MGSARIRWCLVAIALVPFFGRPAAAADELDEVRVLGRKLWQIREEIIKAEDRYYALYNELNKVSDFDVSCVTKGTYGKQRYCRARFFIDAQYDQAQDLLRGHPAVPPELVQMQRAGDYRKAATAVLESSADLRRLASELVDLKQRYAQERERRFKERRIEWSVP